MGRDGKGEGGWATEDWLARQSLEGSTPLRSPNWGKDTPISATAKLNQEKLYPKILLNFPFVSMVEMIYIWWGYNRQIETNWNNGIIYK
jgi:hypothetical protein